MTTRVPHWLRMLMWIAIVGPLWYIALTVVLGLTWPGYDPVRDTQSELGAVNAPHPIVMNVAGFMLVGIAILSFAVVYQLTLGRDWVQLVATALLCVAGLGMVIVGFFPCDAACIDVTSTGRLHAMFSALAAIGLPVAAMLSALVFHRDGGWRTGWQSASFGIGLLALICGPVVGAELLPEFSGAIQRLSMWLPLLWMSAVSARILRCTESRYESLIK